MEFYLLAALVCFVIATVGYLINKYLRLPWMFTVVISGMILSNFAWSHEVILSNNFQFLAHLGMLFFLFSIGIDLEIQEIRKLGGLIVFGDVLLTLTEGFLLGLLFYFGFPEFVSHSFLVALLAGVAFGTVGEVILLALLKEFGLEKTKFGQLALGIGVFDDIFEILALAIIISLPELTSTASQSAGFRSAFDLLLPLVELFLITLLFMVLGKYSQPLLGKVQTDSFLVPFLIFFVIYTYLFWGSRNTENMAVVAAIFSGIAVKQLLPEKFIQHYKKPMFFIANMFLGPFFFLSLGGKMSLNAITSQPILIVLIILISILSRVSISYLLFHRMLGKRQSLILGVGLTAKFSTSVVSENLLFSNGMITQPLYSAIMAAFIILKPIIVAVFSGGLASSKESILEKSEEPVLTK